MKLIRLTTSNQDGSFESLFNTDINIDPKSKIALRNITFQTEGEEYIIDGTNSLISFSIAGNFIFHTLTERTITKSNFNDLILDIQNGLNNSMSFIGKQISTQFRVRVKAGLFEIGYLNSPFSRNADFFENIPTNSITFTGSVNATNMKSTTNTDITNDTRKYVSKIPFIKGCGVSRVKISNMNGNPVDNNSGFFLGVSRTNRKNFQKSSIPASEKDLWIHAPKLDGVITYRYGYIDTDGNPQEVPTARIITLNDVLEIRRVLNQIILGVYDDATKTFTQFYAQDDPDNVDWINYIIMRTKKDDLTLLNFRNTLDPTRMNLTLSETVFEDDNFGAIPKPSPQLSVNNILTFQNASIMEFLGYQSKDGLSISIKSPSPSFFASELFTFAIFNDTYLVILDNINLESFDGFVGIRKSILEVIPVSDDNTNQIIQYEPNNLNFIDIKNIEARNIRNIKGRLLKADLTKPKLRGLTTITILVDG